MNKKLHDYQEEWSQLCNKVYPTDLLNENEKVWYFAQCLLGDVENGGIISFFYNYGADFYDDTIKALDIINQPEIKSLIIKVAELFPLPISELNHEERNKLISG